jgi:hypothetical protein
MTTQTSTASEVPFVAPPKRSASPEAELGFAVIGCLIAGAIGLYKAASMTSGISVLLCVLGSIAAFGAVAYI